MLEELASVTTVAPPPAFAAPGRHFPSGRAYRYELAAASADPRFQRPLSPARAWLAQAAACTHFPQRRQRRAGSARSLSIIQSPTTPVGPTLAPLYQIYPDLTQPAVPLLSRHSHQPPANTANRWNSLCSAGLSKS